MKAIFNQVYEKKNNFDETDCQSTFYNMKMKLR